MEQLQVGQTPVLAPPPGHNYVSSILSWRQLEHLVETSEEPLVPFFWNQLRIAAFKNSYVCNNKMASSRVPVLWSAEKHVKSILLWNRNCRCNILKESLCSGTSFFVIASIHVRSYTVSQTKEEKKRWNEQTILFIMLQYSPRLCFYKKYIYFFLMDSQKSEGNKDGNGKKVHKQVCHDSVHLSSHFSQMG